ncbi:unnamed protein product, partial [Musa acuminata var. zebrina]
CAARNYCCLSSIILGTRITKVGRMKVQNTPFITLIPSLAFVSVSPSSSFTEDLCAKHSINVYFMTIGDTKEVPNLIAFGYC